MKRSGLPVVSKFLLERLALDNEPLAGDIAEEFLCGRSRGWLWRQLARALLIQAFRAPHPPISLSLTPIDPVVAEWLLQKRLHKRKRISLTGSGIEGIGGLTMVILGLITTMVVPAIWWFVFGGVFAGIALGAVLVRRRKDMARNGRLLRLS